MRQSLMISVAAAALFAATAVVSAQGVGQGGAKGGETAPAASSSRGDSAGSMSRDSAAPTTSKGPAGTELKESDAPKSGSMAQDKGDNAGQGGTKAAPQQAQEKSAPASATKSSGSMTNDSKSKASESGTSPGPDKPASADSKTGTDSKVTTGNAATSATLAPPAEKQSQIGSAIRQERVEETTNVNFNLSIGTAVPSSVRVHSLPPRIVEIYPEWRGYEFVLVRGKYIILRPRTHEIVYIIEG